tara:strand:- start:1495 stop:2154 length:660 start_codon:yes stop_codon:yes gene_type:complete
VTSAILAELERLAVVPVVEIDEVSAAVPLADALAAAGITTMEITLRTAGALDAIRAVTSERPDFLVGAGTITSALDVEAATLAGARYLVSPGRTDVLTEAARSVGIPYIPGAVTPTEVMAAAEADLTHVKFFPAGAFGGADALLSLSTPLTGLGLRFMPTGGIRPENLSRYLSIPAVFAVGGTWIAARDLLRERRFDEITRRAREAMGVRDDREHGGTA